MNQHNRAARLCRLFFSTLYISSFTFGGGFVIVTLMKKKFVDELHWITEEEMLHGDAIRYGNECGWCLQEHNLP